VSGFREKNRRLEASGTKEKRSPARGKQAGKTGRRASLGVEKHAGRRSRATKGEEKRTG